MKVAVSIPDELYQRADEFARAAAKPRSQLYSEALKEYLAKRDPDQVTEAMNQALIEAGEVGDPFGIAAAGRTLGSVDW